MIHEYLPFIVIGLTTGSIYAIAAMGLVLTYKTSGVFNFGHGAVGAAAAFCFYDLHVRFHWAWPLAAIVSVIGFGTIAGLILELIGRGLMRVVPAMKIVGTVGILLAIQGLIGLRYGQTERLLPQFLPQSTFKFGGIYVGWNEVIVAILALAAAVGLYLYFRYTHLGKAMRAVVDDAALLDMTGISPSRIRRIAWILGAQFASLAGILIAPLLGLDATLLTLLVVQAFGAAAVGRFTSLPLTYVGGLILGVLYELIGKWVGNSQTLEALPSAVPFLMLFFVLLTTPKGRLPDFGASVRRYVKAQRQRRPAYRATLLVVALALAVSVPGFAGSKTILYATGMVYVGLFLSLGLLTRLGGMVSLCQVGLMAVGAAMFGHFQGSDHLPWGLALILAGLVTVPFGAIVAIPAIRLSGLYLALATFGYATLLEQILYREPWFFGGAQGVQATRPAGFGSDTKYYYLVLAISLVMAAGVAALQRIRMGRLLRALGDSPRALSTHGASINITRVIVFCFAAFLAGLSGAMYVPLFGSVNGDVFITFQSLIVLAVLAVAGTDIVLASFIAAFVYFVLPGYSTWSNTTSLLPALFGAAAIAVALSSNGSGPVAWAERIAVASGWRTASSPVRDRRHPVAAAALAPQPVPVPAPVRTEVLVAPTSRRPSGSVPLPSRVGSRRGR